MHYLSFIIYILLGTCIGLLMFLLLKKVFIGRSVAAVVMGIIGAVIGGNWLRVPVQEVQQFFASYNIEFFASVIGSILLVWLHYLVSRTVKRR